MLMRAVCVVLRSLDRAQVEADENALGVREIADDFLHRLRKLSHQRRYRENLISLCELGVLQKVDHLYAVSASEMGLAQLFQVGERR
jgi:hypothetical protein